MLGWRLGLERMRRLCSLLGMPQNRFASIHVVGTNGKTSVTLMTAALLESQGVRAGAYVSPHIRSWRERILIRGEPIPQQAFDAALERAEQSAQVADRSAGEEGPVTQFELFTAAAFLAFAEARVQYAVVEAGLGGRLDATNVIPSKLTVLTSVGLDHTEWLGDTLEEIALEKLAVVRNHTTLFVGQVSEQLRDLIEHHAERRRANVRFVNRPGRGFQAHNLNIAVEVAEEALGRLAPSRPGEAAAGGGYATPIINVPGRAEVIGRDPVQMFDAAHNPDGARALAEALPDLAPPRRVRRGLRKRTEPREVVCCLAVLEEKDARGIVEGLGPAVARFVCTEVPPEAIEGSGRPGGRSLSASDLARLCGEAGVGAEAIPNPLQGWRRARELARERDGVALAAGSHYLLRAIWTERPDQSS